MPSSSLIATSGRNGAGETIVVSTIKFDPPVDDGFYVYEGEVAVFCDDKLAAIVRRYSFADDEAWPRLVKMHTAITMRALR